MKLDLRDRVQAVIFVYETELNQPSRQDGNGHGPPRGLMVVIVGIAGRRPFSDDPHEGRHAG
jgi:hypothetical protein